MSSARIIKAINILNNLAKAETGGAVRPEFDQDQLARVRIAPCPDENDATGWCTVESRTDVIQDISVLWSCHCQYFFQPVSLRELKFTEHTPCLKKECAASLDKSWPLAYKKYEEELGEIERYKDFPIAGI